jgi:ElaB/YqjD/DUF883 family membrane-anchored ribosome-binding protein
MGTYENRLKSHWPQTLTEASEEGQQDTWNQKAHELEERVERRMAKYPKATLAAAAILGVLVGWMIKRR